MEAAKRFFKQAVDEVRQFFRVRTTMKQKGSLAHQRELFRQRQDPLKALVLSYESGRHCSRAPHL